MIGAFFNNSTRNGNPLTLAAGKHGPTLSNLVSACGSLQINSSHSRQSGGFDRKKKKICVETHGRISVKQYLG